MKFISVIFISILITVVLGTLLKQTKYKRDQQLISPLIASDSNSVDRSNSNSTKSDSIYGWPVFVNNYYNYKIKHPQEVEIKNKINGDISLEKPNSINIMITQDVLVENDILNTLMEKAIDKHKDEPNTQYSILINISPISLGFVTAQTYTSVENGTNVTYYYVPQKDKKYLLITNQTPNDGSADYLTSENIIYSIELLP